MPVGGRKAQRTVPKTYPYKVPGNAARIRVDLMPTPTSDLTPAWPVCVCAFVFLSGLLTLTWDDRVGFAHRVINAEKRGHMTSKYFKQGDYL